MLLMLMQREVSLLASITVQQHETATASSIFQLAVQQTEVSSMVGSRVSSVHEADGFHLTANATAADHPPVPITTWAAAAFHSPATANQSATCFMSVSEKADFPEPTSSSLPLYIQHCTQRLQPCNCM